ncbi:MAG: hypothetical protein ABIX01_02845 [Chitinophagaceae bacterium]
MKQAALFVSLFFACFVSLHSQRKIGGAASVYITTANLDSSVAVYEKLGFKKIGSNEFPAPWAQVSDGSLLITMRKDNKPFIGLTYYVANLDQLVAQLEKDSISFEQKPKPGDLIQRYYIKSPDGFNIVLSGNPGGFQQPIGTTLLTMKQQDFGRPDKYPNKQCGVFGEFAQPVADIGKSVTFWKKLGFTASAEMKEPYPHVILSDGLMIIGLHQTQRFTEPAITYFGLNTEKRIAELKARGLINFTEVAGKNNVALKTWEGQHFFIFSLGM